MDLLSKGQGSIEPYRSYVAVAIVGENELIRYLTIFKCDLLGRQLHLNFNGKILHLIINLMPNTNFK